jgi:hypothetical protein
LDLGAGKRGMYEPNLTSYLGNLPETKEGVEFFFFRMRKR